MSYLLAEQRERINELERMLSKSIDRNKALEEELKMNNPPIPKAVIIQRLIQMYLNDEINVEEFHKDLRKMRDSMKDEFETEEQQDET